MRKPRPFVSTLGPGKKSSVIVSTKAVFCVFYSTFEGELEH